MAYLIQLPSHSDGRGSLTVIESEIPFSIKRIFYIYGVDNSSRGGHRHVKTTQAAICINGSCEVFSDNGILKQTYLLDHPNKCLILNPQDWHTMQKFSKDAVLLVLASTIFEPSDYIFDPY
jgi:dTDP-4-dehydrorhamnose 3,5-epimerase-like enzyme